MMEDDDYLAPIKAPKNMPFYPLSSPGMPMPGPDFVAQAMALGDEEPVVIKNEDKTKSLKSYGPILDQLHYDALYQKGFTISMKVKSRPTPATFIPGHLWANSGTGPVKAKVMVIGKWPGRDEVSQRKNMVGPSGEAMIRGLESIGCHKDEYDNWYVTNLIKHPQLDVSSQGVPKALVNNGLPLLDMEMRIVQPDFIICLGADAAKAVISDDFRFDQAAGRVFTKVVKVLKDGEWVDHTIQVMACIHPVIIAKSSDRLPEFQKALAAFHRLVKGEEATGKDELVDHRVIESETQLAALVDEILYERSLSKKQQIIAIDGEWHGDYPTEPGAYLRTVQFSHKPGFACCVVLRSQGGVPVFRGDAAAQLKRLLLNPPGEERVRIAGHHLRADLPWLTLGLDRDLGERLIDQFGMAVDWHEARSRGGIDTMLAAHAVTEAPGGQGFKLEILALGVCGVRRYDIELQKWKKRYCKENDLKDEELEGYGECPDDVLHPYGCWDADATRRLVDSYIRNGGLLDRDQYGNPSWKPFRESMNCTAAFLEMEMTGVLIDREIGEENTKAFMEARDRLTAELRKELKWPDFNPSSANQCKTLLFGPRIANIPDPETGGIKNVAPPDAVILNLDPVKTSGKPAKMWAQVVARGQDHLYSPSTDKEVLGILRAQLAETKDPRHKYVEKLRNIRFAGQVLKSVLREPITQEDGVTPELDEHEWWQFEKGLLSCIHTDGRVRTHIFQTKETGRVSSARPPLQNLSKRREKDYKQILGDSYKRSLRSMMCASPGYVLVEADYLGAELLMMAIQANDQVMIDHCKRSALKESDPLYYDIHSSIAVKAFHLKVPQREVVVDKKTGRLGWVHEILGLNVGDPLPATKTALVLAGVENLRTAAKTIAFGIPYGRGNDAVIRAVEEEGVKITVDEAETIRAAIFEQYVRLEPYLNGCVARVHNPGHVANWNCRRRRFQFTGSDDGGDAERQSKNFSIQSGVASATNVALRHLYNRDDRYTDEGELKYRFILQIHDALLFEVMIPYVDWFANEENGVLKWAMTDQVAIYATDFDGTPIPGREPFHMATETAVMLNWGESLSPEKATELGVPLHFAKKK